MIPFFFYTAVVAPFKLAFLVEVPFIWKIWDWIVDVVIVLDIWLCILTAYKDEND